MSTHPTAPDTSTLFNAELVETCAVLGHRVSELEGANEKLSTDLEEANGRILFYRHRYEMAAAALYGKKSERRDSGELSLYLPGIGDLPSPEAAAPSPQTERVTYDRKKRSPSGHPLDRGSRFPAHLRRETVTVPSPETPCPCCGEVMSHVVDTSKTEKLCFSRDPFYLKEYLREVRSCRSCETVAPTPPVPEVFSRVSVEESVVAAIIIDKFRYSLPLYRQRDRMEEMGIRFSRATITEWVLLSSALLLPVYKALFRSVMESKLLLADDTPFKSAVRNLSGVDEYKRGCLWSVLGDRDEVVYRYAKSRTHESCVGLFRGFSGTFLVDGYDGFEKVASPGEREIAHCNVHARRNFIRAEGSDKVRAREALSFYAALYRIEDTVRGKSPEEVRAVRQEESVPVLSAFKDWCERTLGEVRKKTPIAKACAYVLSRWESLSRFSRDGRIPLDTNELERQIRVVAIGKKNFLHASSELGAEAVAVFYSLVNSCLMVDVDPFLYLSDVMRRVSEIPPTRVAELLPRSWKGLYLEDAIGRYAPQLLRSNTS